MDQAPADHPSKNSHIVVLVSWLEIEHAVEKVTNLGYDLGSDEVPVSKKL